MNTFLETFILVFAIKGTTDFNKTKFYCSEVEYYWSQEGTTNVGIKAKGKEWVAGSYADVNELEAEVKRQCEFGKKK